MGTCSACMLVAADLHRHSTDRQTPSEHITIRTRHCHSSSLQAQNHHKHLKHVQKLDLIDCTEAACSKGSQTCSVTLANVEQKLNTAPCQF
jgi:hypothetical protein